MKSIDNEIDRILDDFLAGNITTEELRQQHARLQNLHHEQDADQLLDTIQLPEELFYPLPKEADTIPHLSDTNTVFRILPIAVIAMVMGVLLTIGYYALHSSSNELAYKHFERYPIRTISRTLPRSLQLEWNLARNYYEIGNYRNTIDNLQKILNHQPKDAHIDNFYVGLSYLANHQTREAIPYLEQSLAAQQTAWQNVTHWYLGLAYLGNENTEQALLHLEKVAVSDFDLKKQAAQQLLEQLR